jgi:hypothetical protein
LTFGSSQAEVAFLVVMSFQVVEAFHPFQVVEAFQAAKFLAVKSFQVLAGFPA